jgi:hypothetical protein
MPPIESPPPSAIATGSDSAAASSSSPKFSRWSVRRWVWVSGLASIATFALGGVYGVPAAVSSPDYGVQQPGTAQLASARVSDVPAATTTTTPAPTTTTAPAPTTTTTTAPPATPPAVLASTPPPAAPAAPAAAPALPSYGHATVWDCTAALAYLQAYAAPGFALDCPGYAEGHEAMTCLHGTPQYPDACLNGPEIAISDACPEAYMNESANSWLLTGQTATEQAKFGVSYDSIDPFGACP